MSVHHFSPPPLPILSALLRLAVEFSRLLHLLRHHRCSASMPRNVSVAQGSGCDGIRGRLWVKGWKEHHSRWKLNFCFQIRGATGCHTSLCLIQLLSSYLALRVSSSECGKARDAGLEDWGSVNETILRRAGHSAWHLTTSPCYSPRTLKCWRNTVSRQQTPLLCVLTIQVIT